MKHEIKIIKKEESAGTLSHMTLVTPGDEKKEIISEKVCGYLYVKREFQCVDKFVVVIIDGEPYTLKAGDRLVFSARQNDEAAIFCMGDGAMSLLCTYYNEDEAKLSTAETEIEEMLKASAPETANEPQAAAAAASENTKSASLASDLKLAYKIAFTQFRGSTLIVRSLREVWYDRALQHGIDRVQQAYVPYIIIIIGLMVIGFSGAGKIPNNTLFAIMGGWVIAALIIIVPLIFYAALPKPVEPHIKRIDSLSEDERRLYEEDLSENKRVNKIIKRYKMPDRDRVKNGRR